MNMFVSQAPIDFIMRGIMADGSKVGLSLIPGYSVRVVMLRSRGLYKFEAVHGLGLGFRV